MSENFTTRYQNPTPRITQRQPRACQECTRRKVKCDKQIPCSRCRHAGSDCIREKVLVSSIVTKHGEELGFLKKLEEKLHDSKVTVKYVANEISQRIAFLEAGQPGASEILSGSAKQDRQEIGSSLPIDVSSCGSIRSGSAPLDQAPEYAATVTLESLAWGRNYGACYPHRHCNCYSYRSHSEMISINSDLSGLSSRLVNHISRIPTLPSNLMVLPSISDSTKLVHFHITHLAWHHGILHAPTFLEQCEMFWSTGKHLHPLWMALYLSVLSSTMWSIQNSFTHQEALVVENNAPRGLFDAMVETLYSERFLEVVSMYSVQAIALSTEVAHNLGLSDLNATLSAAAIRISQCMGLHKIAEPLSSKIETSEEWHETVERELGKRVWCQIVIQDHFGLCFTDSYNINPKHCSTELPRNCNDFDLEERDSNVPTVTSYVRTLGQMATLVPRLFDELGSLWIRKSLREQYRDVIQGDRDMRHLVGKIPSFLLREVATEQQVLEQPWLDIARRSLAIIAAEKIILIHRPFLFPSFRTVHYPHTRSTCVSAATTIVREHANIIAADHISLWNHSACCVTASIVLCLELLYPRKDLSSQSGEEKLALTENDQKYHDLVNATRRRLASRHGDVIAKRGVRLIDTMLLIGEYRGTKQTPGSVSTGQGSNQGGASNVHIDLQEIVAQFLAEDQKRLGISEERWDTITSAELPIDTDLVDFDFDTWFEEVFRAPVV